MILVFVDPDGKISNFRLVPNREYQLLTVRVTRATAPQTPMKRHNGLSSKLLWNMCNLVSAKTI